jgi:AbrB family looped-hinge helix DNA binding protein
MTATELVKMSAKGQLVVPGAIRDKEGFREGDRFVAVPVKDGVLFRRVDLRKELERLVKRTRETFRKNKVTQETIDEAVRWARGQS